MNETTRWEVTWSVNTYSGPEPQRKVFDSRREAHEWASTNLRHRNTVNGFSLYPEGKAPVGGPDPVAEGRSEEDACEKGTVGCCIAHRSGLDSPCDTW
jgi:hypothetical protein